MKHLILTLLFSAPLLTYAQQLTIAGHSLPELRQERAVQTPSPSLSQSVKYLQLRQAGEQAKLPLEEVMLHSPHQQPQTWSYQDLAFFCKLEVKLEKATNLPIKFRLGEVQYAENREGKYGKLQQQLGN